MIAILFKCLICLLFIIVRECQTLKCWSCSSIFEPGCEDPFKPEDLSSGTKYFLTECEHLFQLVNGSLEYQNLTRLILGPGGKPYCRKTLLKVYGATIVHRGCSFGDASTMSRDCADLHHEVCSSYACLEDGCNGAASIQPVKILFPLSYLYCAAFFVLIFYGLV